MITFVCCLIALIVGYFVYGKFIERIFGIDAKRQTPAYTHQDGVDYIPMPTWKVFMIQFLNIAGLGPIFGAIMGAKFGTASFLWIVLGSIFAGSVHDYLSGMLSLRHNGESLPEIIGRYLGVNFKQFMRGFTVILMVLVGSVFVAGPAGLLAKLTPEHLDTTFWIIVVLLYYILATLLPVDKIIGKIYPLFAAALLFMAIGILVMLFVNHPPLPEITDGMPNTYPGHLPIFPIMFVSIACGAISGFHATQSPLMARCIKNEKYGRPIFFGSMIDKTKTKMGKAKPWMLYGYIGCAVTLIGVFAIPESLGQTAQYAWFFIAYSLLNAVFYTANNIAYSALTALITKNSRERVEMGSCRFIFAFSTSLLIQSVTVQFVRAAGGGAAAWRMVAVVYAIIGLIVNTISVFSIKELPEEELKAGKDHTEEKYGLIEAAKLLFSNKYYLMICATYICQQIYSAMLNMGIYYMIYILKNENLYSVFSWAINIPVIIAMCISYAGGKNERFISNELCRICSWNSGTCRSHLCRLYGKRSTYACIYSDCSTWNGTVAG